MSAPATNNNDRTPRGRSAVGRGKSSPYDSKPPRNELEFRDHHLRRATDDETTNRLYIRLRWHQALMFLVYAGGALLPIVVIISMAKWSDLPAEHIMPLTVVATGSAGAGAAAGWLIRRRGGGTPTDGRAP
ncbi:MULTISPECIES: hypothetical protein [unclassified Micromonospora]|uniref:hypothetical protein n=1 Tax=unclassified Micromonospora TaxID=2617518 RepID=UPI00363A8A88